MISQSDITYTEEETEDGYECECIYATCRITGCRVGPIWGQHERSIRRALATLSQQCDCGGFHQVARRRVQ